MTASNSAWDPDRYELFADHRLRPGLDLLARVGPFSPRRVVDLGCGTGRLTEIIAERNPDAQVTGLDASEEMLDRARSGQSKIRWVRADVETWAPDQPHGLIFSNAALHWLDDHEGLFGRLGDAVPSGGVLAVQMPDNWNEPTHTIPAALVDGPEYDDVADALLRKRVTEAAAYRRWLGAGLDVETWTTTYHHALSGADPVLHWVMGSVLRPVIDALDDARRANFLTECGRRYREAYPPEPDGSTILPFRRLFIVARRR